MNIPDSFVLIWGLIVLTGIYVILVSIEVKNRKLHEKLDDIKRAIKRIHERS